MSNTLQALLALACIAPVMGAAPEVVSTKMYQVVRLTNQKHCCQCRPHLTALPFSLPVVPLLRTQAFVHAPIIVFEVEFDQPMYVEGIRVDSLTGSEPDRPKSVTPLRTSLAGTAMVQCSASPASGRTQDPMYAEAGGAPSSPWSQRGIFPDYDMNQEIVDANGGPKAFLSMAMMCVLPSSRCSAIWSFKPCYPRALRLSSQAATPLAC